MTARLRIVIPNVIFAAKSDPLNISLIAALNAFPFGAVTAVCIILTIIKSMTSPIWPTMTAMVTPKAPKNVPTFDEFSLYS